MLEHAACVGVRVFCGSAGYRLRGVCGVTGGAAARIRRTSRHTVLYPQRQVVTKNAVQRELVSHVDAMLAALWSTEALSSVS